MTSAIIPILVCFSLQAFHPTPERTSVAIDIYNRDLAMVSDVRQTWLYDGVVGVEFTDIAEGIFGHTANIKPRKFGDKITIKGLTYNYDLISQEKLLRRYLLSWFTFTADDATYQGRLLAFDDDHLFLQPDTLDNAIHVVKRSKLDEMFYPGFPGDLYFRPTLKWEIDVAMNRHEVPLELSYLTTGITWMCDYRGEFIDEDSLLLSATFTIANDLQISFPNAKVSLIVGKPHRSTDPEGTSGGDEVSLPGKNAPKQAKNSIPEKLGELYRYELENPVHLEGFQTIQIPFFRDKRLKVEKRYFFPHLLDDQTIAAQIRFDVDKAVFGNAPLAEGDIGLYHRTKQGDLLFSGQDFIPITPTGGLVELTVGQAVDLTARRQRIAQNKPTRDTSEETWQVEVVNGGEKPATVWVEQRVFGFYKVVKAEAAGREVIPEVNESGRLLFPVESPGRSKTTLTFTLSYGY